MKRGPWHILAVAIGLAARAAQGAARFPKPDFDQVYHAPEIPWPGAGTMGTEWLDIVLLTLALSLAAYIALRSRSRPQMLTLGVVCLLYFGFYRKGCLCSVGALQPVAACLVTGQAITLGAMAFFLLPLLFALLFGRVFCAAVCPLGMIQDLVAVRPQKISRPLDAALRLLPLIYFALTILLATTGTAYLVCRFDPFVSLFRFSGTPFSLLLGGGVLLLGIVLARPYCRFLCPYGLLLGWFSSLSWRHASISPDTCISCHLCADSCPFEAIDAPTPAKSPETIDRGVRRLALILIAAPLIVFLSAWGFSRVAPHLAILHEDVRMAVDLRQEMLGRQRPTLDTAAYRLTGRGPEELFQAANERRRRLRTGGWWVGGFVGLVFVARLLAASTRRRQDGYTPHRSTCLSCTRCFRFCPKDHVSRRGPAKEGE